MRIFQSVSSGGMEAEVILDSVREAEGVVRWFDGESQSIRVTAA